MSNGPPVSSVIVKVASRCNLNCSYCYLYNHADQTYLTRPKFMSPQIFKAMIARIGTYCEQRPGHKISLTFHGGEPTLIPVRVFASYVEEARATLGSSLKSVNIQTNGTLLNDSWCETLSDLAVTVGVSLDGPKRIHDQNRVDHAGRGSFEKAVAGLANLRAKGVHAGVLCVVSPGNSGADAYSHFREMGVTSMDFLLPDVSHDDKAAWYGRYGRTPVADYLLPAFDAWMAEDNPEVTVGIFRDLIQRILGGPGLSDSFGNPPMNYVIVETNGSIEALDALKVCASGIGVSGLNVLDNGFEELPKAVPLVAAALTTGLQTPQACRSCRFLSICGGGYLPHRYSRARGFDNPSVWCDDILILLDHISSKVRES